jgi:hypothetical protein
MEKLSIYGSIREQLELLISINLEYDRMKSVFVFLFAQLTKYYFPLIIIMNMLRESIACNVVKRRSQVVSSNWYLKKMIFKHAS